jgi:hypothetical protein
MLCKDEASCQTWFEDTQMLPLRKGFSGVNALLRSLSNDILDEEQSMSEKTTGRKDGCHLRRNILETMELLFCTFQEFTMVNMHKIRYYKMVFIKCVLGFLSIIIFTISASSVTNFLLSPYRQAYCCLLSSNDFCCRGLVIRILLTVRFRLGNWIPAALSGCQTGSLFGICRLTIAAMFGLSPYQQSVRYRRLPVLIADFVVPSFRTSRLSERPTVSTVYGITTSSITSLTVKPLNASFTVAYGDVAYGSGISDDST